MKQVFLESHNVNNMFFGFGQFNYHFIKALYHKQIDDIKFTLNVKDVSKFKEEFGDYFCYHSYKSYQRYKLFAVKTKFDLWHSMNQNTKIEPFYNPKYLLNIHDINFVEEVSNDLQHERNQRFINKLNRSNAIVYISEFAKKSTHQYFEVPKVPEFVIHLGNTISEIKISENYQPKILPQKPFFYSVGEFLEKKNFISLVRMMPYFPEYQLVLSGNTNTLHFEEIKIEITKLNIDNQVIITGKVSEEDKQFYMKNCIAFLFPSLREGFGLPPIEAMRFGNAIFLSDKTSLPEIGGKDCFYFNDFSAENMKNVIKNGLELYAKNENFYKNSYQQRAQSFRWDNAIEEYLKVYRMLLFE